MNHLLKKLQRLPQPVMLALVGVETLVFLAQEMFWPSWPDRWGAIPSEFQWAWDQWQTGGDVAWGVLLTLFTPLFLHGGPEHLLGNMIFLWAFGALTADLLGKWWALAIFFVTGAAGNLLQISFDPSSPIPIIGASGAVCGFEGVYLGLALRWRLDWPSVWPLAYPIPPARLAAFAVIGIAFDLYGLQQQQGNIAYGAHLGGFLAGLAVAGVVTRRGERG